MECGDFLNFSDTLNTIFVQKKISENGDKFLWKDLQWARYCVKDTGILYYISSLKSEDGFKKVNFRRREKQITSGSITVLKIHEGPVPINKEKKKRILWNCYT